MRTLISDTVSPPCAHDTGIAVHCTDEHVHKTVGSHGSFLRLEPSGAQSALFVVSGDNGCREIVSSAACSFSARAQAAGTPTFIYSNPPHGLWRMHKATLKRQAHAALAQPSRPKRLVLLVSIMPAKRSVSSGWIRSRTQATFESRSRPTAASSGILSSRRARIAATMNRWSQRKRTGMCSPMASRFGAVWGFSAAAGLMFSQEVTLPDEPCEKCTLQVMQIMENDLQILSNCYYFHCADVRIPPAKGIGGPSLGTGGARAGTGADGAGGVAGIKGTAAGGQSTIQTAVAGSSGAAGSSMGRLTANHPAAGNLSLNEGTAGRPTATMNATRPALAMAARQQPRTIDLQVRPGPGLELPMPSTTRAGRPRIGRAGAARPSLARQVR